MAKTLGALFLTIGLATSGLASSPLLADEIRNPLIAGETWVDLKGDIVGDAEILDGNHLFSLEAPYRAHDAATVPITISQVEGSDAQIVRLTLIVDENPAPVAAEFEFGEAMGALNLETRVRINAYSNVRALAETADGKIYMTGRFVKASGGCSAPAMKDEESALAMIGKMKLKLFDGAQQTVPGRREAQIMMRHPNYSGLQRNQITQLYIPALFVHEMEVSQGEDLLFRMTAGISISEDPSFRFTFDDSGKGSVEVKASDTDGRAFERRFDLGKKTS